MDGIHWYGEGTSTFSSSCNISCSGIVLPNILNSVGPQGNYGQGTYTWNFSTASSYNYSQSNCYQLSFLGPTTQGDAGINSNQSINRNGSYFSFVLPTQPTFHSSDFPSFHIGFNDYYFYAYYGGYNFQFVFSNSSGGILFNLTSSYSQGSIASIYGDGTYIYIYINGVLVGTTLDTSSSSTRSLYCRVWTVQTYNFTSIQFYPTGLGSQSTIFTRTEVNSSTYSVQLGDSLLGVIYTPSGTVSISLPAASTYINKVLTIVDEGGSAGSNNITITPGGGNNIAGQGSISITTNYGSLNLYSNGSNAWFMY
jgi:hypothetical protein